MPVILWILVQVFAVFTSLENLVVLTLFCKYDNFQSTKHKQQAHMALGLQTLQRKFHFLKEKNNEGSLNTKNITYSINWNTYRDVSVTALPVTVHASRVQLFVQKATPGRNFLLMSM